MVGNQRAIILTNNSGSTITNLNIQYPSTWTGSTEPSATSTCGSTLAADSFCAITITPGTNTTSGCTSGVTPSPDTITVTSSAPTVTLDVYVLGYGCQYQQGLVFSVDDNAPLTSSIGLNLDNYINEYVN